MSLTQDDLAKLEGAMLDTYRRELGLQLNDRARLKAVYGSHFFDADRRLKLETVCMAAKQLLDTDMAAVNMITDTIQVQVASSDGQLSERAVEEGYCQHVVGAERDLSVEDSLRHALVCEVTATTEDGIRAYLGVPLISQSGHIIGSLCVWSYSLRHWSPTDVSMLASFAAVLMRFEAT